MVAFDSPRCRVDGVRIAVDGGRIIHHGFGDDCRISLDGQRIFRDPAQHFTVQGDLCPRHAVIRCLFFDDVNCFPDISCARCNRLEAFRSPRCQVDRIRPPTDSCRIIHYGFGSDCSISLDRQSIFRDPAKFFPVKRNQSPSHAIISHLFFRHVHRFASIIRAGSQRLIAFHSPWRGIDCVRGARDNGRVIHFRCRNDFRVIIFFGSDFFRRFHFG